MSNYQVPVHLYMSRPVHSVLPEASLEEAHTMMIDAGISSLPVENGGGALVGLLSRTDLLRVGRRESGTRSSAPVLTLPNRSVSDEMTHEVVTVSPETTVEEAAAAMVKHRIHRVVVTEAGKAVGLLSTRDLMRAIDQKGANGPVSEFMSSPVFTIRADEALGMAVERLENARVSGLVVVEDEWPVGVFTQSEALEAKDVRRSTPIGDVMNPRILTLAPQTRLHRAAAQAAATGVRRVVIQEREDLVGILSGLDFARAMI